MKHILHSIAFLIISVNLFAQTQQGYVKTNGRPNRPGTPLQNVTVKTGGHAASLSDDEGHFSIAMPGKKGGDPFVLTDVTKQGYELADRNAIGRQYSFSEHVPFAITMISQEELQADKKRIRDNALATAQKEYSRQLNILEQKLEEKKISEEAFSQAIQDLQSQLDKYGNLAEDLANRYARTDYDIIENIDKEINEAIEAGDLQKADSLITSKGDINLRHSQNIEWRQANKKKKAVIDELISQLEESENKYVKERNNLAEDYYHKFTIAVSRLHQEEAFSWLEKRTELDPDNFDWLYEAAKYCRVHLADYNKALRLIEQANMIAARNKNNAQILKSLNEKGTLYNKLLDFKNADKCYKEVILRANKEKPANLEAVANAYNNMGINAGSQHNIQQEIKYCEQALELCRGKYPEIEITIYNNLSACYYQLDMYDKAQEYIEQTISRAKECHDQLIVATAYGNLAAILFEGGKLEQSIEYHKKSLEIKNKLFPRKHPLIALSYKNLAASYTSLSKYKEAFSYASEALKIYIEIYGETHPDVAQSFVTIAQILNEIGIKQHAIKYAKQAEQIYKVLYDDNSIEYARLYNLLGALTSDPQQSYDYYKKALAILEQQEGANQTLYATVCANISFHYRDTHNFKESFHYIEKALDITESLIGKNNNTYISYLTMYATICEESGDFNKARQILEDAQKTIIDTYGRYNKLLLINYNNLGTSFIQTKEFDKARENLLKSKEIADVIYDRISNNYLTVVENIAMTYYRNAQYEETIPLINEAYDICTQLISGDPIQKYKHLLFINDCYCHMAQENDDNAKLLQNFVDSTIVKVIVADGNNQAREQGLEGEYYLLEHTGWNITSLDFYYNHNKSVENAETREIVILKNGKIQRNIFKPGVIGVQFYLCPIDKEEKARIVEMWQNWKKTSHKN